VQNFVKHYIVPILVKRRWTRVCEIGASRGVSTQVLAALPGIAVTVIDPCLDCDLNQTFARNPHLTIRKGTSLEVLPSLQEVFDCILIDGDHNWYTVYHELKVITVRNLLRRGGMMFLHDVEWPWGRRDMYYQPESIPQEHRHSWEQRGIVQGQAELSDSGGFLPEYCKAKYEGGARNGVLTAIEDFLREHSDEYRFFAVRGDCGLGVMYRRQSFAYDLRFSALNAKNSAHNALAWLKQFTKVHFPAAISLAKLLSR
jgi:hypothetical protein